jgi:hypothetical protein
MSLIQTNRAASDVSRRPTNPRILNAWALAIVGTLIITVSAGMAAHASRLAVEDMGLDAARMAVSRIGAAGVGGALVAGAGSTVLLAMAGRVRWAIAYTCWLGLGTGVVVATILVELGFDVMGAAQQGGLVFAMAGIFPAFFFLTVLMAREGMVRPITWLLDLLTDMLNAIATLTPWGPRWGKVLAVLAAIWLVVGTTTLLLTGK